MLTISPSSFCITDQQTEFSLFNNQKSIVYAQIKSSNQTAYEYPKQIMEIQPLTSYKFIIYVKIQRQTNDNDNVTIQYDNDSQLKFPKLLKINITTASVTQQQIKNIFYQMDYESLQKEQILLQNQLRSIKKQIFEIESQGTFLFIRRKDLEKSVSNIEIHLGINLKDWKQRVRKVIKSSQNAAFVATAYIVGFILALKW